MRQLDTINEYADTTRFKVSCAHSSGKPDVPTPTTNISVRFASLSIFEIGITHPTKHNQRKNMKTKALLLAALSLTVMALAGCGKQNSEENTSSAPEMTNSADEQPASVQPMPAAAVSNNVVAPPASVSGDTNISTATNATGTTTNQ
jgi:hypothetical protein